MIKKVYGLPQGDKVPQNQFINCINECKYKKCPPDVHMRFRMGPDNFTCELWREDEDHKSTLSTTLPHDG